MFAKSLRTFDDALRDISKHVSLTRCDPKDLEIARDQYAAAKKWLAEYRADAARLGRSLTDRNRTFFDTYVVPTLAEVELRMKAAPDATAQAIAVSIRDARSRLLWCLHQLD